jgi:ABC-type transport system involved in multi-copper enzyme maturation permease subunit
MSLAVVRKELREHGVVLALAGLLSLFTLLGLMRTAEAQGGRFQSLGMFELIIGTLLVLVLSNRLLAREYAARTQLFLEILPVSRVRVFATKWLLGAALFLGNTAFAWLLVLSSARRNEAIVTSAAFATLGCISLYALTLWSFAALAGMLGRYRYFAWILAVFGIVLGMSASDISMEQMPVLRLLGDDVLMARTELTAADLLIPAAVVASCIGVAATLALRGSGAIASLLAQRMTAREVSFIVISTVSILAVVGSLEPKPVKPKFALSGAKPVSAGHASVVVLPTRDFDANAAAALANIIVKDVDTLLAALGLQMTPSIAILPQQGLDADVMQRAALRASDGIVLKTASNAPQDALRALVLHSLLSDQTLGRGLKEDRHVLLDGLAAYWPVHADSSLRALWWLRAAAVPQAIDARQLSRWSQTAEQLGDCLSQAVAFAMLDVIAAELGRERLLQLMQRVFARPHDDVRALFEPAPEALLASAGLSWRLLAEKLEAARSLAKRPGAEQLQQRAKVAATVNWREDRKRGLTIEVNVRGVTPYRVLYGQLGPWTGDVGNLARLDVRSERAVLPISPPRGARVLTAVEAHDAVLGCPVRVLARRVTLR